MKTITLKNWAILTPMGKEEWQKMISENPWGFELIVYKYKFLVTPHAQMFPDFSKDNWTFKYIDK